VGITEITVRYHRPAVAGRPIWGGLVPYGEVWRAGANENTTLSFSTDVKVGGKALPAGTYGLHVIPTAKEWTFALSKVSTAWGSFTYDAKEDALRVTVTPRAAPMEERVSYRFEDVNDSHAALVLDWEKLEAQVPIDVDTPNVTMANVRQQLRGLAGFNDRALADAAEYWIKHGGPLDEALKFADRSVAMRPGYRNLTVRAEILDKQHDPKAAADARAKALALATEGELNQYAYGLMGDGKIDDAVKMFQSIVDRFPNSWNAQDSLGEALAQKGNKAGAIASYSKALALATDAAQKKRIEATLTKLKSP